MYVDRNRSGKFSGCMLACFHYCNDLKRIHFLCATAVVCEWLCAITAVSHILEQCSLNTCATNTNTSQNIWLHWNCNAWHVMHLCLRPIRTIITHLAQNVPVMLSNAAEHFAHVCNTNQSPPLHLPSVKQCKFLFWNFQSLVNTARWFWFAG